MITNKFLDGEICIGNPSTSSGEEYVLIELKDKSSCGQIIEIRVSHEVMMKALQGRAFSPCKFSVSPNMVNTGKKRESKNLQFEITSFSKEKAVEKARSILIISDGWQSHFEFDSHDSFFMKDGKNFARCTIYRYVENTND